MKEYEGKLCERIYGDSVGIRDFLLFRHSLVLLPSPYFSDVQVSCIPVMNGRSFVMQNMYRDMTRDELLKVFDDLDGEIRTNITSEGFSKPASLSFKITYFFLLKT